MTKVSEKYRRQLRREAAQEAVAKERARMREELRQLIQDATREGHNAVTAWWLAKAQGRVGS